LLRLYDIPAPAGGLTTDIDEALVVANDIRYPIVLKIEAEGVHHKTEIGGVALGIGTDEELQTEYIAMLERVAARAPGIHIRGIRVERLSSGLIDLIVGGRNDPQFGPVVVAGLGGVNAEVLQDVSTRLAPVDSGEARAMLDELRGSALLGAFRGRAAIDFDAVVEVIVRASRMLAELPEIRELDLNPILAGAEGDGCIALDALVVV
jgi:acetate---CoA ligase (ADP-forming)